MLHRYFILNKPYNMVSQFVSSHDVKLLGDIDFEFPEGTHAIGRLDKNSEGLLLLTTNTKITRLLFQGKQPHSRTYLVQVRHKMTEETAQLLRNGIAISAQGGLPDYITQPCSVKILDKPSYSFSSGYVLWPTVPNTWIEITLTEGKFHQVRKMVDAVHHGCKRLIRISIEDITLENIQPGEVMEIPEAAFFSKLKL
jgi:23S rRNA pseudouridine2457 synthase